MPTSCPIPPFPAAALCGAPPFLWPPFAACRWEIAGDCVKLAAELVAVSWLAWALLRGGDLRD